MALVGLILLKSTHPRVSDKAWLGNQGLRRPAVVRELDDREVPRADDPWRRGRAYVFYQRNSIGKISVDRDLMTWDLDSPERKRRAITGGDSLDEELIYAISESGGCRPDLSLLICVRNAYYAYSTYLDWKWFPRRLGVYAGGLLARCNAS